MADPRLTVIGPGEIAPADERDGHEAAVTFVYELGSPDCYLALERLTSVLPLVPELVPIDGTGLPGYERETGDFDVLAARAAGQHLLPLVRPAAWPFDGARAARAATYTRGIGKVAAFSLAATRQAFAGGRDLGDDATLAIAGAACEIHPRALLKGIQTAHVERMLAEATATAAAAGITRLPAVTVDGVVFSGPDAPEQAAVVLPAREEEDDA